MDRRDFLKSASVVPFLGTIATAALLDAPSHPNPRITLSLDGSGWKLCGLAPGEGERLGLFSAVPGAAEFRAVSVPNDVQMLFPDPCGQGKDIIEINRKEWWYVRPFRGLELKSHQQARLVFEGVDYFADVWLNGEKLGSHEGAFTSFAFDITRRIRQKDDNRLAVRVTAPWKLPGRSHFEFMKGGFEESWDALPGPGQIVFPLGLHRSVRVEVTAATRIEELGIATTRVEERKAVLQVRALVSNNAANVGGPRLQLSITPENFSGPTLQVADRAISFRGERDNQEITITAEIRDPQLWWTWDLGPQNLYRLHAALIDSEDQVIDSESTTFGIRTIERDDKVQYKINGVPVFLRGAWFPQSTLFPAEVDRWVYQKDLLMARHANMNHLINFSQIETDDFYDLADRLGILLFVELPFYWHGPMDALNAKYGRREQYLEWCSSEVAQMVRRIGNHPSVGVWAPVTEIVASGYDNDFRLQRAMESYPAFFQKMEEIFTGNDRDALHWRSYCDYGEQHFWDGTLMHPSPYDKHFENSAKFVSEYGGLGYYPPESIRRILDPADIWNDKQRPWSDLEIPVDLKKLSYLTGFQYMGVGQLVKQFEWYVDRRPLSFQDFVSDSQVWQAFIYQYAADSYRRKLFQPVNGLRSWMFKSFPHKPINGYGVIDCFNTPLMAYYAQRRTFAAVAMSFEVRYSLESRLPGSSFQVPVWISNSSRNDLDLSVECDLFNLEGHRIREFRKKALVPPAKAQAIGDLDWTLPPEPGIYLLRGRAIAASEIVASQEMYVKVVPGITRKVPRVLLLGTPQWAPPVFEYLKDLGAAVTAVVYEPTPLSEIRFPESAETLARDYDVIWLTGFGDYWLEVPDAWSNIILRAVESGVTFVHTGSWASFHGGAAGNWASGGAIAALDLTPLEKALPVEVKSENDVIMNETYVSESSWKAQTPQFTAEAPEWLKRQDLTRRPVGNYHLLAPRPGARVLMKVGDDPLLVSGQYGRGRTIAYLGFSRPAWMLDRIKQAPPETQLFARIAAVILALACGEEPSNDLLEPHIAPMFETLKRVAGHARPDVSLTWKKANTMQYDARVRIRNGGTYLRGFRVRFEGADFLEGSALPLWSDQYFDLLPNEEVECDVRIHTKVESALRGLSLKGETLYGGEMWNYPVAPPPDNA